MKKPSIRIMILIVLFGLAGRAFAVEYVGRNYKDPFDRENILRASSKAPDPNAAAQKKNALVLQGLTWNINVPHALINGKIVKIGDTVEDAQVLGISKEGVVVRQYGRDFVLYRKGRDENEKK